MSAMFTVAVNTPTAAGLKVTVTMHEDSDATLVPQVLVCEKELAFVPVMLKPIPESAVLLALVIVTCLVGAATPGTDAGKVRLVGDRTTA